MRCLTVLLACLTLCGCQQVATYQMGSGTTAQLYTVVQDPDKSFQIFTTSNTQQASGSATVSVPTTGVATNISANGTESSATTVVTLAQSLDQVNTQLLGAYKAALFGLNANPTGLENRDKFWETIGTLNQYGLNLRLIALTDQTANAVKATATARDLRSSKLINMTKAFLTEYGENKNVEIVRLVPVLQKLVGNPSPDNVADARLYLGSINNAVLTPEMQKATSDLFVQAMAYRDLDNAAQTLQSSLANLMSQVAHPPQQNR